MHFREVRFEMQRIEVYELLSLETRKLVRKM